MHNCRIRPICARCTRGPLRNDLRKDLRTESRPFHLHLSHEAERDACRYARFAPDTDHRSRFTLTDNGRHPKTMRVRGGKCHEMSKTWVLAGSWHEISDLSHCLKQRIPNTGQVSNWASHAVLFASRNNLARYNEKIAESSAAFEHRRILPRPTLRPSRITACGSLDVVHIGRHSDMPGKPRCKGSTVLISL